MQIIVSKYTVRTNNKDISLVKIILNNTKKNFKSPIKNSNKYCL